MNPIPKPDFTNIHLVPISVDITPKVYQGLRDATEEIDSDVDTEVSQVDSE